MGYVASPVLGYPSKRAAIVGLSLAGEKPPAIAKAIGSSIGAVYQIRAEARKTGELPPRVGPEGAAHELTRGEARAIAEAREAAEMEAAEMAAAERRQAQREQAALEHGVALAETFGLTPTEARYLDALADGRPKRKEALFAAGGHPEDVEDKIVDVMICKLRDKLAGTGILIDTIWGAGYVLAPPSAEILGLTLSAGVTADGIDADRRAKTERILGASFGVIAAAVDMPPAVLALIAVRYLAGAPAAEQLALAAPSQAAVDADIEAEERLELPADGGEPSRADDEAELARLAALDSPGVDDFGVPDPEEEVAEAAGPVAEPVASEPPPALFRLQNPGGAWLRKDMSGFTWKIADAWRGSAADIERIGKLNRRWLELEPMRAT